MIFFSKRQAYSTRREKSYKPQTMLRPCTYLHRYSRHLQRVNRSRNPDKTSPATSSSHPRLARSQGSISPSRQRNHFRKILRHENFLYLQLRIVHLHQTLHLYQYLCSHLPGYASACTCPCPPRSQIALNPHCAEQKQSHPKPPRQNQPIPTTMASLLASAVFWSVLISSRLACMRTDMHAPPAPRNLAGCVARTPISASLPKRAANGPRTPRQPAVGHAWSVVQTAPRK